MHLSLRVVVLLHDEMGLRHLFKVLPLLIVVPSNVPRLDYPLLPPYSDWLADQRGRNRQAWVSKLSIILKRRVLNKFFWAFLLVVEKLTRLLILRLLREAWSKHKVLVVDEERLMSLRLMNYSWRIVAWIILLLNMLRELSFRGLERRVVFVNIVHCLILPNQLASLTQIHCGWEYFSGT